MKFVNVAAASAAFGLATAAPSTPKQNLASGNYQVTYVDKFDKLKAFPVTTGIISQVGTYHGFNYQGLGVSSDLLSILGNSAPSGSNFIYGDPISTKSIQLLPANDKVIHFELCYLSYACSVIGSPGIAQKCTIQITGQKEAAAGGGTVIQELVYDPALLGSSYATTNLTSIEDWKKLTSVTINLLGTLTPQPVTIVQFDNIGYLTYYKR